ncbi:LysM peptidoglycan-binding domain-containing protein [Falsihalocynthiibacter arcticus]|uniref:LysM peptidoglycan-binding domain-containing protein n=1 Tax=Falsihalocynthiibacter arcticus TaxID=1579316 RepID=UPI0012E76AAD|nr:hypothetical protein [Falsihalocynthiibacter arcticus]
MRRDPRKRYSMTERFTVTQGQPPVFGGLMPRRISTQDGYILHMLVSGDRLDKLALHYYGDPRLWWVIAQANPGLLTPADLLHRTENPDGNGLLRIGADIQIPPKPEEAE